MITQATIDKLHSLKLKGMATGFVEQLESPLYKDLSFEERMGLLVDREAGFRENRKVINLLKNARFRYPNACLEDIDFRADRGLAKDVIVSLSLNDWIRKKHNILISGPSGVGKTFISCALGNSACRAGLSTYYVRAPRLLHELSIARSDGSYGKTLSRLSRIVLLIIDDWGLAPLADKERRDLLEILEDRYDVSSTIIASPLPIEKWHDFLGDPTVADAVCDRIIHNSYKIALKGESMRKVSSKVT